jgi:hypothetical protein
MLDGREMNPVRELNLEQQALDAIKAHNQPTIMPLLGICGWERCTRFLN